MGILLLRVSLWFTARAAIVCLECQTGRQTLIWSAADELGAFSLIRSGFGWSPRKLKQVWHIIPSQATKNSWLASGKARNHPQQDKSTWEELMLPLAQESGLGVKVVLGCLCRHRHVSPKIRALWAPKPAPCLIPRSSYFQHLLSSCKFSLFMFETNSWEGFLVGIISKQ